MNTFLGIFGIFDRATRLREEPLLADIYADVYSLRNSSPEDLLSTKQNSVATRYVGPEKDKENFINDKRNMASDFYRAFGAAKQRLES